MEEIREISREEAIEEEMIKEKLEKAKKTGEVQEIKTEIPAGTLIEQVKFKKFKNVEEGFREMFVAEDLTLVKGEKTISLREMTPKSIRYFVRDKYNFSEKDDDFAVEKISDKEDPDKVRMKIIIYGDLSKSGNVLSLFHEIGHTHPDPKLELDLGNARDRLNRAYYRAKGYRPTKQDVLYRPSREGEFRPVKRELANRFLHLEAKEERNAWAYAIRALRKFKREGLDLEPEMKKLDDFERFIYGKMGLGGYVIDEIGKFRKVKEEEEEEVIHHIIKEFTK